MTNQYLSTLVMTGIVELNSRNVKNNTNKHPEGLFYQR
jgi:hypothetical protein